MSVTGSLHAGEVQRLWVICIILLVHVHHSFVFTSLTLIPHHITHPHPTLHHSPSPHITSHPHPMSLTISPYYITYHHPHPTSHHTLVPLTCSSAHIRYSDGSVFLWDLTVDSEPAKMTQPTGVYAQSKPSCSVVRGTIAAVGTTGGEIAPS